MRSLLLLVVFTGCVMVPTRKESTIALGRRTTPTIAGSAGQVALQVTQSYATVHVMATRVRHCFREVKQSYEHRVETVAALEGGDLNGLGDPRALVLVAVAEVPLLAVSGLITGIAVAASDTKKDRYEKTVAVLESDCSLDADNLGLDVIMPSGATMRAKTNDHGLVSIAIPGSEPTQGVVVVRSLDGEVQIGYSRDGSAPLSPPSAGTYHFKRPPTPTPAPSAAAPLPGEQRRAAEDHAFKAVRAALRACGEVEGVHGVVAAQLAIDTAGHVTSKPDRGGAPFATCVNEAIATTTFPRWHAQQLVFPYRI